MKKKYNKADKQGFISMVTVILMMTSLGVVFAMLYRSTQGNLIVNRLKQSNQAYQDGDSVAESILMNFKRIDNRVYNPGDPRLDSTKKIPQNILATVFCIAPIICYDASAARITNATNPPPKLSDVTRIGTQQTEGPTARALQVSVPQRVFIPTTVVTTNVIPLTTNVKVSWTPIIDTADNQYDKIEVRRAELNQNQYDNVDPADLLSDPTLDWTIVKNRLLKSAIAIVDDTTVTQKYYAYTLKMTNKQSLNLDSLYVLPKTIQVLP